MNCDRARGDGECWLRGLQHGGGSLLAELVSEVGFPGPVEKAGFQGVYG
jgi:hypothetical protein